MTWQPWKDYEKGVESLDIVGPPCIHCKFWKPQRTYEYIVTVGVVYAGVNLCVSETMYNDFSCYRSKEEAQ